MKFYKDINGFIFWNKIINNNLTAVYSYDFVQFFKNGKYHNSKNADYIHNVDYLMFCLNCRKYGFNYKSTYNDGYPGSFTKKSWRIFVKLQAFL